MANKPRSKGHHSGHGSEPPDQHHGSTAEETAALNETFKAFSEEYHKDDPENRRRERVKFRVEVGVAIGVALNIALTAGLLIAAVLQANYSRDQVKASQDQVRIMDDQEKRQLRAYIGVALGDVEDFGEVGKQRVHLVRKNFGLTPAYDVGFSAVGSFVVATDVLATGATFDIKMGGIDCAEPNAAGLVTMFPSAELPLTIGTIGNQSPVATAKDIENVKSGKAAFVYFGSVCYHDAFAVPHFTHYCYLYTGTSMTSKDAEPCLKFNDAN
jgi:hypothetical protein